MLRFAAKTLVAALAAGSAFVGVVYADSVIGAGRWSTSTGDMLNSLGVEMQARATNNAELNGYRWGGRITRDGFATAGDGGQADYTHSALACSISGGDGGAQIPSGTGGCWNADLTKPTSAAVWGVKSDCTIDDQPAWDRAVKALGALNGGGTLVMPVQKTCSKLNSTLQILASNVQIVGGGADASVFGLNFATGNGIEIGGNPALSGYAKDVTLERIGVRALVTRTSGANISVYRSRNALVRHVKCSGNYYICHDVTGSIDDQESALDAEVSFLSNEGSGGQIGVCIGCLYTTNTTTTAAVASGATTFTLASTAGMYVGQYVSSPNGSLGSYGALHNSPITAINGNTVTIQTATASALSSGTTITVSMRAPVTTVYHHLELTNHNFAAMKLANVGGLYQDSINTNFNFIGLLMEPFPGQQVSGIFSDKTSFDANGVNGFLANTGNGGLITNNVFNSLWVASCGSTITQGIIPTNNPSSCVRFTGPAGTIFEQTLQLHISASTGHCVEMDASARDITLSGNLSSCSFQNAGPVQGIYSNGATHWSWDGKIGITSNVPGVYPNAQQYSVYLTGASDFVTISGDIGRSASGTAIFNNATGTNFTYDGVVPALPWIATTSTMSCQSGALSTSGQSAAMRYQQIGKTIRYNTRLVAGTNGSCSGLLYTLPFSTVNGTVDAGNIGAVAIGKEVQANNKGVTSAIGSGSNLASVTYVDGGAGGATGANNTTFQISGQYERQ